MQFRFVGSTRRLYSAQLAKPPDRLDRTCVGMRRTARQYSTEQQLVTTCLSVCGHAAKQAPVLPVAALHLNPLNVDIVVLSHR